MKLTQAYLRKLIMEELLNEQPESPQRKDLEAFQLRQAQVSNLTKDVVAEKVLQYVSTLRGVDMDRQKQTIIDGLTLALNMLKNPIKQQQTPVPQAPKAAIPKQ